jgi:hypothetical protein
MMFLEGYIGAPPTVTVISLATDGKAMAAAKIVAAMLENTKVESFMNSLL